NLVDLHADVGSQIFVMQLSRCHIIKPAGAGQAAYLAFQGSLTAANIFPCQFKISRRQYKSVLPDETGNIEKRRTLTICFDTSRGRIISIFVAEISFQYIFDIEFHFISSIWRNMSDASSG